jgi:hypothetical protein
LFRVSPRQFWIAVANGLGEKQSTRVPFETKRLGALPNRQWSVGQPASVLAMPQLPVTPL